MYDQLWMVENKGVSRKLVGSIQISRCFTERLINIRRWAVRFVEYRTVSIRLSVTWVLDGRWVREALRIRLAEFKEKGNGTASWRSLSS
jgi:hypothetical protein